MEKQILKVLVIAPFLLVSVSFATAAVTAQETDATNTPAELQIIQVTTADGLTQEADYWALSPDQTPGSGAPAVVVMRAYYATRRTNLPLVETLLQAGYHVLLVWDYRQ